MGIAWKFLRVFRIGAAVFGALALVGAAAFAVKTEIFLRHASVATATIVSLDARRDSDGDLDYYPEFSFSTVHGQTVSISSSTGSNPAGFYVGEQTKVFYDPAKPADAQLGSFLQLWLVPCVLGLIGTVWTGAAVGLWWWERRRLSRQR